jgi:hypothetical protein
MTTPDPDLAKYWSVKEWLQRGTDKLHQVFLRSNLYTSLPSVYHDLGTFGTAAMHIEEDFKTVIHTTPYPIGSYAIGMGPRQKVRVFYRAFQWTVRQIVETFALDKATGKLHWENVSDRVKWHWDSGHYETWVECVHVITPNLDWSDRRMSAKYKQFRSVYYERGIIPSDGGTYSQDFPDDHFLSDSGYDRFPIVAPRWEVNAEDVYGTNCPGMTVLNDIKELYIGVRRLKQAVGKMVNPPLKGPTALKTAKVSLVEGDITYIDEREGQKGLTPIHEVNSDIKAHMELLDELRERIKHGYYQDLFLMMTDADDDRKQPITAAEVAEKKQEKMLGLGPVLQRCDTELLRPTVEWGWDCMVRQGMLEPPPPELHGQPIFAEYISMMALAQKAVGIAGTTQFLGFVGQVAQIQASGQAVLDNVDFDKMVDDMADKYGVDPEMIIPPDVVAQTRQQRQQQQAAAQKAELAEKMAGAANKLGNTPTDPSQPNALQDLLNSSQAGQLAPLGNAA